MDQRILLGDWLDIWLNGKKKISEGTRARYASDIKLYLKPYLGHILVEDLRVADIADMFDAVEEYNDVIREARVSDDPALRVKVKWRRVVNPPTMRNIQATLRHALYIGTPRPSPVMVWTPEQTRRFLDQARKHRLYPLYRLIALRGLRRGEACGVRTTEVDLKKGTVGISWQITQLGWNPRQGKRKTDASDRTIDLDTDTIKILRHHRARQNRDRLAAGMGETEFFFTDEAGQPLHPAHVTD